MTKNEEQNLEALKIGFENTEWEDFLLVLNEIRDRDKEIIKMYRHKVFRLTNGCNNALNNLEFPASPEIAVMELKKALAKEENYSAPEPSEKQQPKTLIIDDVSDSQRLKSYDVGYKDGHADGCANKPLRKDLGVY